MNRGWYKSTGRLYEIRVKNMENGEAADESFIPPFDFEGLLS